MENVEPYGPTQSLSTSSEGGTFVETFFGEGPLGVTLRRRPEDGIVFIYEVIPNSQAVSLDVQLNDELWAVADSEIGKTPLDKEAWNGLITFIKQSARPLRLVWRRSVPTLKPESGSINTLLKDCDDVSDLQRLVDRFVVRDRDSYRKLFMIDPSKIVLSGRRLIKQGDLVVDLKNGNKIFGGGLNGVMWSKSSNNRRVILCNDILIVTMPLSGNMFGPEYIFELATCKIRSLGHVFGVHRDTTTISKSNDCSFDLIFPGGELQFLAEDTSAKDAWVINIYLAMCECVDRSSRVLGWRHQYLLGTMHSAVIKRDEDRVKELIAMCDSQQLDFISIEAPDEDGYTPLHYACMLRLHGMVKILHEATADVTVPDNFGFTPLHWAALQLDNYSLELLCTHVFDVDLEDNFGRTPLVLACIEGRDISGKTDPVLMKKCIDCLLSHKPNLTFADGKDQTLFHYLSASWQYDGLESLLEADSTIVNAVDNRYFMSPLHFAASASPIKLASGDGMRIITNSGDVGISLSLREDTELLFEERDQSGCQDTLRVLLQHGAKPNQKDLQGRTPLMIILESQNLSKVEQESAISVLLSHGARADDITNAVINNSQSAQNLLRSRFPDLNITAFVEKWNLLPCLDCNKLSIKLNHFEPIIDVEQSSGSQTGKIMSSQQGSPPMCFLCGFQFTLFRRQHHCRLCNAPTCDDCSRKRAVVDGNQVRACDCCYNRILHEQKKFNKAELLKYKLTGGQSLNKQNEFRPLNTTSTASEKLQREQLLGGFVSQGNSKSTESTSKSLSNTFGVLSETHEQLQQRGEKLSQLSDRSADMANQANEFARLAKQLNEQQKSRWF